MIGPDENSALHLLYPALIFQYFCHCDLTALEFSLEFFVFVFFVFVLQCIELTDEIGEKKII